MKNETVTRFRAIVKRHEAQVIAGNIPIGNLENDTKFFKKKEAIQADLTQFIRSEVFAALPKQDILTLVCLCCKYICMPLHSLGMACEKQAFLRRPEKRNPNLVKL
jgi:hypothetical protein